MTNLLPPYPVLFLGMTAGMVVVPACSTQEISPIRSSSPTSCRARTAAS